jgi:hypothetical protein
MKNDWLRSLYLMMMFVTARGADAADQAGLASLLRHGRRFRGARAESRTLGRGESTLEAPRPLVGAAVLCR